MPLKQIYCKTGNTCYSFPLEKRKIIKKTISRSVAAVFLSIFFAVFLLNLLGRASFIELFVIWLSVLFILIVLIYIFQRLYYRYYFYDLKQEEAVIYKGVVSRKEINLPYTKIQNVYIDQDVLDRIFKLYDVHLETAGLQSGLASHIDGVNRENAHKLRDMLMNSIKQQTRSSGSPAGV